MQIGVVIPALRPGKGLVELVGILSDSEAAQIFVVDDGSGPSWAPVFAQCASLPKVTVLRHAVNLGKGAALKTAMNHAACEHPGLAGIVTADADGQHHPDDILAVARTLEANADSLVIGARGFSGSVPLRSRVGNTLTRYLVRLLIGESLEDTQTGLRGIPRRLIPSLLVIPSSGYEFELDMLIAARHQGCPFVVRNIRTIYEDGNASSHFNPLFDSMRIYFVLFRFSLLSLLTAFLDNAVFYFAYPFTGSIAASQALGRLMAVLFNYTAARRAVFLSGESHRVLLPRYLLLVLGSGLASYGLIRLLNGGLGTPVIASKLIAESLLFALNFLIQRDVVFKRREQGGATDWDKYYSSVPFTAKLTRKYTTRVLLDSMKRYTAGAHGQIVEIGGANSCFLDRVRQELRPATYHVVDNNRYGLDLLRQRVGGDRGVELHEQNVLALNLDMQADLVYSVGLIEHFNATDTRRAIDAHFRLLKPDGVALITFPTPTWLYRAARSLTETAGLWKFPDERPLEAEEVRSSAARWGEVKFEKTLWPLVFTQRLLVVRKAATARAASTGS